MRGLRHRLVSWLAAVAVLVAGCGWQPSSAFFPQHSTPLGAGYEASVEGRLVLANGCLWIEVSRGEPSAGAMHVLIVWPSNTTLGKINDLPVVLGPDQELLVEEGTMVRLGGRSVDIETAQELAGRKFPGRCADGGFWVASTVENRP
jgi:hypothetical protein